MVTGVGTYGERVERERVTGVRGRSPLKLKGFGKTTSKSVHKFSTFTAYMQGLVTKNKCDTFVLGSGRAKSYSLGWQFLTFPIGVASSKRHKHKAVNLARKL